MMRTGLILLCVLSMSWLSGSDIQDQPQLPFAEELQAALDSTRLLTGVMGVSAAIIVPGYAPWLGVSGESHPGNPITRDMVFDLASAGKLITAALMLHLCEDGLISLDEPISAYLAAIPHVDPSINIRQLLNHTSGLYDMVPHPGGPFRIPYDSIDFEKWWTIDEIFTRLGGDPYFSPGEGYHYTQAGYQLATLIVEQVTGSTAVAEIQKRLLDPLGLNDMLLDFSKPVPGRFQIAHPWVDTDGDGIPEDVHSRSRNWIASLSRILYYTTAKDFAVFTHELLQGRILNAGSMEELLTFVHPKPEETGGPLFVDYGLGIMDINPELMRGQRTLGHLGSIPGYRAFTGYFPDLSITMVILYNSDTDAGFPIVDVLLQTLLEHYGQGEKRSGSETHEVRK